MRRLWIMLAIALVLVSSCATVERITSDWEVMSAEQAAFERTLLVVTGVAIIGYGGYLGYVIATTEPFPDEW